ncbi:hypothetical protein ACGFNU_19850 [Spirillospora sp. NPDC048911]|uniref:hypothetical protein n=1 Tax=Spirillospora sp. NPDC048911 TaxID=3364527 RepID=UPI003712800C
MDGRIDGVREPGLQLVGGAFRKARVCSHVVATPAAVPIDATAAATRAGSFTTAPPLTQGPGPPARDVPAARVPHPSSGECGESRRA